MAELPSVRGPSSWSANHATGSQLADGCQGGFWPWDGDDRLLCGVGALTAVDRGRLPGLRSHWSPQRTWSDRPRQPYAAVRL